MRSAALCSRPATVTVEPPRRALERGPDPDDPSYSVTVLLPNVDLCAVHASDFHSKSAFVGWCDDERCRLYGEAGQISACGQPFEKLAMHRASRSNGSTTKQHGKERK